MSSNLFLKNFNSNYFKNKFVIITGASGGLGVKMSKLFNKLGANLILIDKINVKKIKPVKKNTIHYFKIDFTSQKEIDTLIEDLNLKYKRVDILINNAAYTGSDNNWIKKFGKQKIEDWHKVFKVGYEATFSLSQGIANKLKRSNGRIINIGSIFGTNIPNIKNYKGTKMGSPAAYAISKNALLHLTKWLAVNMAPNVNVNMISPGGIKRNQPLLFIKKYNYKVPLSRMCTEEDILGAIIFLSSNLSNYVTGHNLIVDGGYSVI
tara:strand:+ start:6562 stop:7353 length:792 start_codon:yes stop_codon:yes gene_type:complete